MIDFRYHLVSIVAVFLALAIGIVLGSTELQGHTLDVLQASSNSLRSQLSAASAQRDSYQAQSNAAEQYLQTAEPVLLSGRLTGQRVVLITEPGAQPTVISGIKQAAAAAGATVTGEVALQPRFNDISGATQSSLATINGSIASSDGVSLTPGTAAQTTYQQQAAQLIATAILTKSQPQNQNQSKNKNQSQPGLTAASAQTLLSAYVQMGFLTVSGTPTDRATLAVLVTPQSAPSGGQNDPVDQVLLAIAPQFATASSATVAAGSTAGSAQAGSGIGVLRASSASAQVSTVDNADTTLGQISVIEALAAQLAGRKPSSYGVSGASAVSPDPLPSALPTATPSTTTHPKQTGKSQEKTKK
jgi:hypothetical protein